MRKAVFGGFIKIIIITLAICAFTFSYFMTRYSLKQTENEMHYCLNLIDYILDYSENLQEQIEEINPLVLDRQSRITIMDTTGRVAADTSEEIDYSENHIDREEVKGAVETGTGISVRRSETENRELLYYAVVSQKGDYIIRLAVPYNGKAAFLKAMFLSVFACIILAILVAYVIARRISHSITRPLSEISDELLKIKNGDEGLSNGLNFKSYKYDEINNIAEAKETLTKRVNKNIERLRAEKNKVEYILDNMSDGIIFIDSGSEVININKAAREMLGSEKASGQNIAMYTHNIRILESTSQAIEQGEDSIFDIKTENKKTASVHVKSIHGENDAAASILLIDVTNVRENEKMRQEFFSNASHELKTPLTSIQGYSELLTGNLNFSDEQKNVFLERIKKETKNMTSLINDILMISRLENGEIAEIKTEIKLKSMVNDILAAKEPNIKEKNLTVTTECEDISLHAEYKYFYQLLSNIISNAVKYNKDNGSISIKIYKDKGLNIIVSDTGIGIPPKSRERVFERFYRVDKGRSKKIGGTGLGLAIVKHIVNYYNGKITLKSKEDKGTVISIKI
ncbi:MAG: ATP-binding protein [Clostridiales bacterium]|nr:ATP-binding protein [Clostridiales bacterium]